MQQLTIKESIHHNIPRRNIKLEIEDLQKQVIVHEETLAQDISTKTREPSTRELIQKVCTSTP
jgi:hypothetical protein